MIYIVYCAAIVNFQENELALHLVRESDERLGICHEFLPIYGTSCLLECPCALAPFIACGSTPAYFAAGVSAEHHDKTRAPRQTSEGLRSNFAYTDCDPVSVSFFVLVCTRLREYGMSKACPKGVSLLLVFSPRGG